MTTELRAYDEAGAAGRLQAELPHWCVDGGCLLRRYRTSGWKSTLMAANAIAHLAEAAWHHPDLALSYNRVEVRLKTHDADAITDKDFALARKIEEVIAWQPGGEEGPLTGPPDEPRFAYLRLDRR